MLVAIGIMLLLAWLSDYAVHLTAGSLIDLLLLFASIAFALDYIRRRSVWDRRPNWDHRPPKAYRRQVNALTRWMRSNFRSAENRAPLSETSEGQQASVARGQG